MSSVQERLQLKRVPVDTWNIREQLCLASAVVRSGDQNWMSVSRALKTTGDPNRPPDWYSQKCCAAQYGALLEHVQTPKRKKRSSEGAVETPQVSILKRLTQERIVEIQKNIAEMTQHYEQIKNEIMEARNPLTSEERLKEMSLDIEAALRKREKETLRRAQLLREREERKAKAERTWRPPSQGEENAAVNTAPSTPTTPVLPTTPSSPLLTSLLKSSPVVTTPQHISHPANVVETVSPSAGAPTLSMLLEKGSASPHDTKTAAIEHIKNQLVQIEQQLKANTSTPPSVPLSSVPAVAPAVDIDDIEIKAEDVYAFRDVDIHIAPVTHMHKPASRPEKPVFSKSEQAELLTAQVDNTLEQSTICGELKQEEPMASEPMVVDEVVNVDVESPLVGTEEAPPVMHHDAELKLAFPEVKFPTTEIKVIAPDDMKVQEEAAECDALAHASVDADRESEQVDVEEISVVDDSAVIEPPVVEPATAEPQPTAEPAATEPPAPAEKPEDIPLPPEPDERTGTQLAETPEAQNEAEKESVMPEKESQEQTEIKVETSEEVKNDDPEDSNLLRSTPGEDVSSEGVKEEAGGERQLEEGNTETDDDTPMELSREEEKDGKKRRDYSRKKKPDSRTCSGSESAEAEASAPDSPCAASDAERQQRLWKKSVMLVYSRLCAHKYASIFQRPITDEEAPGYSIVIKRPMDLTTIRRNIDSGAIRTTSEFQRDVLLMLSNALMYNSSEHSVYAMAKEMFEEAVCQLGMLLAAHSHAGLGAGGAGGAGGAAGGLRRKRLKDRDPRSSNRMN